MIGKFYTWIRVCDLGSFHFFTSPRKMPAYASRESFQILYALEIICKYDVARGYWQQDHIVLRLLDFVVGHCGVTRAEIRLPCG